LAARTLAPLKFIQVSGQSRSTGTPRIVVWANSP